MTPEQFRERLNQDLAAIGSRHNVYSNDGQKFVHWVLESVFRLSDAEARSANFDGPGDGGLDGFYIDQNEDLLRLVQCKYSETIERDARDAFVTLPHKLKSPERIAESNPSIYDCSLQFKDGLERNLGVHMSFVFLGANRGEYTDEIKGLVKGSLPTDEASRYEVEVVGIDELILRYAAKNPFGLAAPHSKNLRFEGDTVLNYQKGDIKGLVMNVNGHELAAFGDSPGMFLANFRYFLDARNKVNARISDTIQERQERANIWAYNNGVTIICDRYDEPDLAERIVKIYAPQIVNGCQTVSTLNRPVVNRFSRDTSFVVRVIASTDSDLTVRNGSSGLPRHRGVLGPNSPLPAWTPGYLRSSATSPPSPHSRPLQNGTLPIHFLSIFLSRLSISLDFPGAFMLKCLMFTARPLGSPPRKAPHASPLRPLHPKFAF